MEAKMCQVGIIAISSVSILMKFLQLFRIGIRYMQWKNLMDLLVYGLGILSTIDMQQSEESSGLCWKWPLLAVTLTLAWLNLLGDFRHLPSLGIYIIMFFDVLKTFMNISLIFLIFIVAFGLGFHLLCMNQVPFHSLHGSLLKTVVMMTGEFEYESMFHHEINKLEFPSLTFVFYLAFLVVMSIILVNLLIGLAVDDINAVQDQAILKRLAMQVELALDVERILPQFLLRKLTKQREKIEQKSYKWYHVFREDSLFKTASNLSQARAKSHENMTEIIARLSESVKSLKSEIAKIAEDNKESKSLLQELVKKNGIYMDDFLY